LMSVGDRVFQVAPWMVFPQPITAQATTETHWNGLKRSAEKKHHQGMPLQRNRVVVSQTSPP
jgi:hypothetical protein